MRSTLFNDRAHQTLSDLLDRAELWAIREGICDDTDAQAHLASAYIRECDSAFTHIQCYIESEEILAAENFIRTVDKTIKSRISPKAIRSLAFQLFNNKDIYFTSFQSELRIQYLRVMNETVNFDELRWNGIAIFATATLKGAIVDMRRELRRRGATFDCVLVPDDTYKRIMRLESVPKLITNR